MFILYEGYNDILITTLEREAIMIKEWFIDTDRDLEEYDRSEINDSAVNIIGTLKVDN